MNKISGTNLLRYIGQLPKNQDYTYVHPKNKGRIRIVGIDYEHGTISIRRWDPSKGESYNDSNIETISKEMIWRLANAFSENFPINVDRIFGGSYNTRSVLESLVAHTPQFYSCYPGRIEDIAGETSIKKGHKHLIWKPEEPHTNGEIHTVAAEDMVISEIPTSSVIYGPLIIPDMANLSGLDIDAKRRHLQIQIALYCIGKQLNYRTWIAQNDMGVKYLDKPLFEHEGIIKKLDNENLVSAFDGAVNAGRFIDCIWFANSHLMPAVMEVEHTTGVTSGLDRMLNFYKKMPSLKETRFVIVAPDEDRDLVIREATKPQYKEIDPRYFPYSSVEELYSICQRRKLRGVTMEFLDCYMEPVSSL